MKNILKIIYTFYLTLTLLSCEDLLLGPQPRFMEKENFVPALNVFGILRPTDEEQEPPSFLNIDIIAPTLNDTNASWIVEDAMVTITDISNKEEFIFSRDTDHLGQIVYMNPLFRPAAGRSYELLCEKAGYESVYARTFVPEIPGIKSISQEGNQCMLELETDTLCHLYDVYAYKQDDPVFMRYQPDLNKSTNRISLITGVLPDSVVVYAYDKNLANYYGSTNVFIKPNTYRQLFSSVENGYGCMGAMNKATLKIK